jgi:hypothetical protein
MKTEVRRTRVGLAVGMMLAMGALHAGGRGASATTPPPSFLNELEDEPSFSASTVPKSGSQAGDQAPYGVTVAPIDSGVLRQGDLLVSHFDDAENLHGNGASIVRIQPDNGTQTLFFDAGGPIGLTNALVALRSGVVVVGSAQRTDSTPATVSGGSLIFLDSNGKRLLTLTDSALLGGPWGLTVNDSDPESPRLFVGNVLTGAVVRILAHVRKRDALTVSIESVTKIGSGFAFRTDPDALVIGPTGLAWDSASDALFVADTGANRIARIDHASRAASDQGPGATVFSGPPLAGPLGLALVPKLRHLVATNGDSVASATPNLAVELTLRGALVATKALDDSGVPGGLVGVALAPLEDDELSLAFVNANSNTVNVLKTESEDE